MPFTTIKKSSHTWQKFSNDYDMIQLQNQQFTNNTLHERKCSTELLVFSKGVLKRTVILLDKLWNAVEGKIRYAVYQLML